jgi:hypothetical protein
MSQDQAYSFAQVLEAELVKIQEARQARQPEQNGVSQKQRPSVKEAAERQANPEGQGNAETTLAYKNAHEALLVGLAFSGGGIRSATFNLGVLQALAELKLLRLFDYLSTVSGGGYIGSWLTAWIYREGMDRVEEKLSPNRASHNLSEEPPQIEFLRHYSNYLTPRAALFSAETWMFTTTYLRNLLIYLTIVIAALTAVLLVPRLAIWLVKGMVAFPAPPQPEVFHVGLVAALLSLALGILFVLRNLAFVEPQTGNQKYPYFTDQGVIQSIIVLLLFLATWFGSCWLYSFTRVSSVLEQFWPWMVGVGVVYAAPYFLLFRFLKGEDASAKVPEAGNRPWWVLTLSAPVAGAVGGLLLWGLAKLFQSWGDTPSASGHLASWGTPVMILVFTLTAVVHMSLIGRRLSNEQQEWWSRLGGWILVYTLGWVVLFGMALYSPLALMWVGDVGGGRQSRCGGGCCPSLLVLWLARFLPLAHAGPIHGWNSYRRSR